MEDKSSFFNIVMVFKEQQTFYGTKKGFQRLITI